MYECSLNFFILNAGKNFAISTLEKMCTGPVYLTEQVENMIMLLNRSKDLAEHADSIIKMIYLDNSIEKSSFFLLPLHSDEFSEANFTRFEI